MASDADLAEGRRLVADLDNAQWDLGDLAIRIAGEPTVRGKHDPNRQALDQYAEEIGIAPKRLAEYRSVAAAWAIDQRIQGAAWSLHRGLITRDDRADHLQTFLSECREQGLVPTRDRLRNWSPHPVGPDEASVRAQLHAFHIYEMDRMMEALETSKLGAGKLDDAEYVAKTFVEVFTFLGRESLDNPPIELIDGADDDVKAELEALATQFRTLSLPARLALIFLEWFPDSIEDLPDLGEKPFTEMDMFAAIYARARNQWRERHFPAESNPWEE